MTVVGTLLNIIRRKDCRKDFPKDPEQPHITAMKFPWRFRICYEWQSGEGYSRCHKYVPSAEIWKRWPRSRNAIL